MTDDGLGPEIDPSEETLPSPFDQPPGTDWFLASILQSAERFGIEPGVTLTVGGSLVTGQLTTARAYFLALEQEMATKSTLSGFGGQSTSSLKATIASTYGVWAKVFPAVGENVEEERQYTYIHLRGARVFLNGRLTPPTLWRGKLASVDGFSLGTINE